MKFFVKKYDFSPTKRVLIAGLSSMIFLFLLIGIHFSIIVNSIENFKTETVVGLIMNASKMVYEKFGTDLKTTDGPKSWLSILDEEGESSQFGFDLFGEKDKKSTKQKNKETQKQSDSSKVSDFSKVTEELVKKYGLPRDEQDLNSRNLWVIEMISGEKLISSSDPNSTTISINNLFRVKKESTENNFVVEERKRGFFLDYDKVIKAFTFQNLDLTVAVGYIEKPIIIPFNAFGILIALAVVLSLPFLLLKFVPEKFRPIIGSVVIILIGILVWMVYLTTIDSLVRESTSYTQVVARDLLDIMKSKGFDVSEKEFFEKISQPVGDVKPLVFVQEDGSYVVETTSLSYYLGIFENTFSIMYVFILLASVGIYYYFSKGGFEKWLNAFYNYSLVYTFIIFALLLVIILIGVPFVFTIVMSFTSLSRYLSDLNLARQFVGTLNYQDILNLNHILARVGFDFAQEAVEKSKFFVRNFGSFYDVLVNTFVYTLISVIFQLVFGITFAVILNDSKVKLRGIYQVLLILPWVIPTYISALLWREALGQYGVFKQLFDTIGLEGFNVYSNSTVYFLSICFVSAWYAFPFIMIVALSGLQGISDSVKDAALIDGANWFTRLFSIYLPLIRPTLLPSVLLSSIWTFNNFNIVFLYTGGNDAYDILITRIYDFVSRPDLRVFTYGYASAYSVLVFAILLMYILAFARVTKLTERSY
ncbi:MAG: sugar ABC transporter permease [Brevinematales bacterium]|nr:sugar ABC transporter permease [Brevinematales bacterium]